MEEIVGVGDEWYGGDEALRKDKGSHTKVHLCGKKGEGREFSVLGSRPHEESLTKDTPKDSHLARERGNTGKSTARIARMVMSIMWALYTVKDMMGGKRIGWGVWGGRWEGRGEETSLWGKKSRRAAVGRAREVERARGTLAKRVTDSKRGNTRRDHCATKPRYWLGKRVFNDA